MPEVVLMGEPMAMFMADEYGPLENVSTFTRSLAGAEVNVGIGLTRLGHNCIYLTRLGDDPMGRYIANRLQDEHFDPRCLITDKRYPTAVQFKGKVRAGDPDVVYYRRYSAASHMTAEDVERIDFNGVRHVHITGIPPALSQSCRKATYRLIECGRKHNAYISFDPNLRVSLWESRETMVRVINDIASKCDMILPGAEEGKILTGSGDPEKIADFYQALGVKSVIVKIGKNGAYVRGGAEGCYLKTFPVPREKIVDTVGAGDGFAVGVISGRLEGLSLRDSVIRGNAIGSIQVENVSDNEGLPTLEELKHFYAKYEAFEP